MRVLALMDGSPDAMESLTAFDGIVHLDSHLLPYPLPPELRNPDIVVIALSHFPGSSIFKMISWLASQNIAKKPRVICLPPSDLSRLSSELRDSGSQVIAMPASKDALLESVERLDRRFAKFRAAARRKTPATVQSLSRTFGGLLGRKGADPTKMVEAVSDATEEVTQAMDDDGLGDWLRSVKNYHSYTARHCMSVAGFAAQWSRNLGIEEVDHRLFIRGALLHDIGKMRIPLDILDKSSQLTDEEYTIIKSHPLEGKRILEAQPDPEPVVIDLAYTHHELLDGSGYPEKLVGDEINDMVRCLTVVDIYSALVDTRAYKKAMTPDAAFAELLSMSGKLDIDLVRAFRPVVDAHQSFLLEQAA